MKNFIKIKIKLTSAEEGEILISELAEHNFYAFEQEENMLIAYIKERDFEDEKFKILLRPSTVYVCETVEDRNWNQEWESQLQPVVVNNFVGIRAAFHQPLPDVAHEIIITPKMSFGTGHHATTFLMIQLMEETGFKNKSVLDFGTGTGVLAILAEKLGAASVTAIDNDEWSISNAMENIGANQCKNIILVKANTIIGISSVDIIVANINFNILRENAEQLSKALKKNSVLIISGFLLSDEQEMVSVFAKSGFVIKQKLTKDGWLALRFENQ